MLFCGAGVVLQSPRVGEQPSIGLATLSRSPSGVAYQQSHRNRNMPIRHRQRFKEES
ncbi:unnamed protein product [Taenia asiatica]|uniref:Secreted protein n=1 Tax=Taenia asiatica TaxID=60517 RepID=A0A0R3W5Q3_TAEAS|nr:unnamed protein product [Taenia asiatica]